jgi:hypothetical protein
MSRKSDAQPLFGRLKVAVTARPSADTSKELIDR